MNKRPKLSVYDQVLHMKKNGIRFNLVSEDDAIHYLENNTYFFKIKAYDTLFEKYQYGEHIGEYVNLDFAYLQDLAIIDMYLRHFLLKAAVDIEHCIKVQLLRDFNNSTSDGYDIVEEFFLRYPDTKDKILRKRGSSYCDGLIDKLELEGYAIWNVIELLSFGDFISLYSTFYELYPNCRTGILLTYPMKSIKNLRNAAAHNNCILDQIQKGSNSAVTKNKKVNSYVSKIRGMQKATRIKCMNRQVLQDFSTLIYVIDIVLPEGGIKDNLVCDLDWLINTRAIHHADYYKKNNTLVMIYQYVKLLVDNLKESR